MNTPDTTTTPRDTTNAHSLRNVCLPCVCVCVCVFVRAFICVCIGESCECAVNAL
ncbi:MAG TPA: hypothetical protein V6C97_24475 [Oculatellaceae cyanobacterium]